MLQTIRSILVATLVMAAAPSAGIAEITLGAPFADHMVLQRDRPIRVWGEAEPGADVEVRVGPRRQVAKVANDGQWTATLEALPAGGPFVVSAESRGAKAEIKDVLVGDVWLCSGQSNMQMTLKECDGGPEAADAAGTLASLRLCTVAKKASAKPESTGEIRWRAASPESARDFSGVGYFFAADLLADPALKGVPIGVIDSSFGGTMCEGWIPREFLARFAPEDLRASMFGIAPSGLYNAMIAPLGRAPIKGVVWYQGEANADRPGLYPKLLATLFASWRDRFETPELPFIVVGLPDFAAGAGGLSWAWIREAQAAAVREDAHAALALGINTHDGSDLHPRQKRELARRVALLALRDVYGRPVVAEGPKFARATAEGDSLRVTFDTAGEGLVARDDGPLRGFAVAGEDDRYRYADAAIDGDSVVLRSDEVPSPRTVRYAWGGAPDATLAGRSGLPAAPFRTDTLPPPDADVQHQPITRLVRMKSYEATVNGNGSVTSLIVGGKQFLSNEPGNNGGTCVPGWFGPRSLADIREPGPGCVSCSDGDVTLFLEFGEPGMNSAITNRGKDEIRFRICLAPKVQVDQPDGSGPVKLTRGDARVVVTGVDSIHDSEDGKILEIAVGPGASKRLRLAVGSR